jgi:hypothetical protein
MTLAEALRDPNLFARHFRNKSWRPWFTFLATLFAEAPRGDDLEIYRSCTGREAWPASPFAEAVTIVGRRGGKSRILALIATYLATLVDYGPYLAAGEVATVAILAADRSQARSIFRFVVGFLQASPLLEQLIMNRDAETIELRNRVVIEITTASFRATRGYSYAAVLADEVAFWRSDETSANPDVEILRALRPGLASIPGSMLMIASSPYAKRGELYAAYRRHFGKDNARVLVWKASTEVMNSAIDPAIIAEAYQSDPEAARAEYGAEFRDDLADYISKEAVDAVTMWGRSELPPLPGISYSAFCDPSGGVSDAMTLAIGHLSGGDMCVVDALAEIRPPFDPEAAVGHCAMLLRRYVISTVTGDHYAGEWPVARFREHGIEFIQCARAKSALYQDLLPLLNAGRIELLDNPRLSAQLCGLERRTARSGKDSIDHAPGGHDDVANAVAGVLVNIDLDRRPALVDIRHVTGDERGVAEPRPDECRYVFLVVVDAGADIAAVFCGSALDDDGDGMRSPKTLFVLDADILYFRPGLWGELASRLGDMKASQGSSVMTVFAPEHIAGHIRGAEPLPPEFDPELMVTFASECIGKGLVRFCPAVTAKMQTRPIAAALALKAADKVETALRAALIAAIYVKYAAV